MLERLIYHDPFGEDEGIHKVLQFAEIIRIAGKIAHGFDRECLIHIEISRCDESFIDDEVVDGFYESFLGLEISFEDLDLKIGGLDILSEESLECGDRLSLLYKDSIVCLKEMYGRSFGDDALEEKQTDNERNKKNKIMEEEK